MKAAGKKTGIKGSENVEQVYQVLYCGKAAKIAAYDLLSRERKHE